MRLTMLVVVACAFAFSPVARGGETAAGYETVAALCEKSLDLLVEEGNIPALQVAVGAGGRIVYSEAFGWANVELRAPATTTTKFRIASVSKPMTGTVAARLATQGRLDLDASVRTYLPDYPEHAEGVTARLLAGHLGGIRHYKAGENNALVGYGDLESALAIFAADPLVAPPGEKSVYSTYGFTLLGAVMERASGEDFAALLRAELFEPVGMTHTVVDRLAPVIEERAAPYVYRNGEVVNAPPTDHGYKIPGGGLLSTAEDLVRFGMEVAEPSHLRAETVAEMTTPMRTNDGKKLGYGMGWALLKGEDGRPLVGHSGSQAGSRAFLLVDPEADVAVALLSNVTGAPFGQDLAMLILDRFVGAEAWAGAQVDGEGGGMVMEMLDEEGGALAVRLTRSGAGLCGEAMVGDERIVLSRAMAFEDRVVAWGFDEGLVDVEVVFGEDGAAAIATVTGKGRRRFGAE